MRMTELERRNRVVVMTAKFYKLLGVNTKEFYHIYADMKMRKNGSRTYFLDKMQESVNREELVWTRKGRG